MHRNQMVSISRSIVFVLAALNVIIVREAYIGNAQWMWALTVSGPLFLITLRDVYQKKQALTRDHPLLEYMRYLMKKMQTGLVRLFNR